MLILKGICIVCLMSALSLFGLKRDRLSSSAIWCASHDSAMGLTKLLTNIDDATATFDYGFSFGGQRQVYSSIFMSAFIRNRIRVVSSLMYELGKRIDRKDADRSASSEYFTFRCHESVDIPVEKKRITLILS